MNAKKSERTRTSNTVAFGGRALEEWRAACASSLVATAYRLSLEMYSQICQCDFETAYKFAKTCV
eukprot:scaffold471276_cov34-Prasinocladus_malaysianus.AAC.1